MHLIRHLLEMRNSSWDGETCLELQDSSSKLAKVYVIYTSISIERGVQEDFQEAVWSWLREDEWLQHNREDGPGRKELWTCECLAGWRTPWGPLA